MDKDSYLAENNDIIILHSFDDFIDFSFATLETEDKKEIRVSVTPIYILFKKVSNFFKDLYETSLDENSYTSFKSTNSFNICMDKNIISKIINNHPSTKMIFYGAILGIYIPILNASIIAKSNKDNTISFYYYLGNIFIYHPQYTLIREGEELSVKFFRLNARPKPSVLYYYNENRFSIYDNNMNDLRDNINQFINDEDGDTNKKRIFGYFYSVFKSLSEEIIDLYDLKILMIESGDKY